MEEKLMKGKLVEICYNAREAGMIDDPRTTFDMPIGACKHYGPRHKCPQEPRVCGNCTWYSVQQVS